MPNVFASSSTCETDGDRFWPTIVAAWQWPIARMARSWFAVQRWTALQRGVQRRTTLREGEILACGICLSHNARLVTAKIITVSGGCHARITSPVASRRSGCGSWDERVHAAGMAGEGGG